MSEPDVGYELGVRRLKQLLLLTVTLLLMNPVVLYLLTGSIPLAALLALLAVVLVQGGYAVRGSALPAVYAVNVVALLSLFLHAELIFDTRFSDYAPENLYTIEDGYYFNRPLLAEELVDKEYATMYLTNIQGYRIGYGQQVEDRVDEADWLFLGDSFTQAAQVDFEQIFTTLLYRHFPDKIVVNAGISGFGVPQAYRYYEAQGRRLKPQTVFLQLSAFNDFMNVSESKAGLTDHLVARSDFLRYLLQDIKFENPPELPLGRWTEPFQPDEEGNRDYNVFYTEDSDIKRQDLGEFERYVRLLAEAVERDGAELVIVLIPTKEQTRDRFLEEVLTSFEVAPALIDFDRPSRLLQRICSELGIELIDLAEPFRTADEPVFFDYDEHLTAYGHIVMAESITKALSSASSARTAVISTTFTADRYPIEYEAGGAISFQSWRDGNTELFVGDSTLRHVRRLTYNDVDEAHPMLSPDLTQVVFTSGDAEEHQTDVVLMNVDGTGRRSLLPGPDVYGAIPSFDRGARRVAYAEWRRDHHDQLTLPYIVILDLGSGERYPITKPGEEAWRPVFSPDGGSLAYIKRVEGQFDIFVADLELGVETRVTRTPQDEWDPNYSPDGHRLVYASQVDGNWDLFSTDLRDGARRRLTRTRGDEWDPSYSPDGTSVLFGGEFGFFKGIYRLTIGE